MDVRFSASTPVQGLNNDFLRATAVSRIEEQLIASWYWKTFKVQTDMVGFIATGSGLPSMGFFVLFLVSTFCPNPTSCRI
jgi:hypothetical protein